MNDFPVDEPRYTRIAAAQLADVSIVFLERCESERLIQVRVIRGAKPGYSARDIRELARIGRLHSDLELVFQAIEVVLNMRQQLLGLQEQLEKMERDVVQREERLTRELVDLRRRLAAESGWK